MALTLTSCRNHPERPGIGVCPACATPVCEECATRVDGILHCRACLSREGRSGASSRWRSASALAPAAVLAPLAWLASSYALYALALGLAAAAQAARWLQGLLGSAASS